MAKVLSVNKSLAGLAEPVTFTVDGGLELYMRRFDVMKRSFPVDTVIGSIDIGINGKGELSWNPPGGTPAGDMVFYAQLTPCFVICEKTNEVSVKFTESGQEAGTPTLYVTPSLIMEGDTVRFDLTGVPNSKVELMLRQFPLDVRLVTLYLDSLGNGSFTYVMNYKGPHYFYFQNTEGVWLNKSNEVLVTVKTPEGEEGTRDPGDIFGIINDTFADMGAGVSEYMAGILPKIIIVLIAIAVIYFVTVAVVPVAIPAAMKALTGDKN